MQESIRVESMPMLYREVLDSVARLERAGDRAGAYDIRRRAIAAYSSRWDERGRRALEKLLTESQAKVAATQRNGAVAPLAESARPA